MADQIDLVKAAVQRATEAGEAVGLYLVYAGLVTDESGAPARPFQIVAHYTAGERAFAPPATEDDALAVAEVQLERMDVEETLNRGDDDPLTELERSGG